MYYAHQNNNKDQELTFAPHINRLCRDCYYQLCQLRTITHFYCYSQGFFRK